MNIALGRRCLAASFLMGSLGLAVACDDAQQQPPTQARWRGNGTFEPSATWTSGVGDLPACTAAPLDLQHTCEGGRGLTCARMLWWYDEVVEREYRCWIDYGVTVRQRPRFDWKHEKVDAPDAPAIREWQFRWSTEPVGRSRTPVVLTAPGREPLPPLRFTWRTIDPPSSLDPGAPSSRRGIVLRWKM